MKKINPYILLFIYFCLVFCFYLLGWSTIFPKLTIELCLFCFVFMISLLMMSNIFNQKYLKNNDIKIELFPKKRYFKIFLFLIIGTIADGIYSGGFPLFGQVTDVSKYGIPLFHTLLYMMECTFGTIFFAIALANKKNRKKYIIMSVTILGLFLLSLSRISVMVTMFNYVWLLIYYKGNNMLKFFKGKIITVIIFGILLLFGFGCLGNLRTNLGLGITENVLLDSDIIMQIGGATNEFKSSIIPKPFFWVYIYIASPLANFQNLLAKGMSSLNINFEYFFTLLIPDVLSKRLFPIVDESGLYASQITGILNARSFLYEPYYYLWWVGIILMCIFVLVYAYIWMRVIKRCAPKYYIIALSLLNSMYLLLMFENTFRLSWVSLQLLLILVLSFFDRIKIKRN